MLATQPPLNYIFSDNFHNSQPHNAMKNGRKSDHLVFTLEDDISDQVLKSKNDEDTSSGTSSVALWIKSLKENNVAFDESSHDSHSYTGSSSDQDDLQLGAEANDLRRRKHRTQKQLPPLGRDSDSDSSYNRWHSWTGRRSFLTNTLSYDRSLDSDTSGLSSVTSVSSLLTARESDPEDVLKGLGFRGPSVLDKIPDRFINTGTICDGVDSEQFLYSMQNDSEDAKCMNSEIPPWVMSRFDDIPRKFWNQKEDPPESTDEEESVPFINEPSADEIKEETPTRPPKPFPSKFGTYLEPVTEEVELSSQGSITLSPMQNVSFESTRSTLKANSQDGPENMAIIPSLCDLWQTTEDAGDINSDAIQSEERGIALDDTGNNMPASNMPGVVDQGCNGDWVDRNRDDTPVDPWNSMPTIADIQQKTTDNSPVNLWGSTPTIADIPVTSAEDIPAITSGQWFPSQTDTVPSLSAYLTDNDTPVSDDHQDSLEVKNEPTNNLEVSGNDKLTKNISGSQTILIPRHPSIPTVTISEPGEKSRKISTVDAPDIDKLLPLLWPDKSEQTTSLSNSKGKVSCNKKQTKATQFNSYATQNWAIRENKRQPQIQFSNKGKLKGTRKLSMRSRKTVDTKVTLSVSQCRKTQQVIVPGDNYLTSIPCFSDFGVEFSPRTGKTYLETSKTSTIQLSGGSETSKTGTIKNSDDFEAFQKQGRNFMSLPLEQTENSSVEWNFNTKKSRQSDRQGETRIKDVFNDGHLSLKKEECLSAGISGSKTSNGMNIEEELDGLQNSLKGVKIYKAGIHLMQLASSVETVMCSQRRPKRLQLRSSERLLDSIQKELKHLEEYILRLQKQLKGIKKQADSKEERSEEVHRRGSDFSDITRQLLQEQLKMFNSISSAAVSPTSTPSVSREPSLCSETPDVLRHTDVMKLRKEMQQLRQDSVEQNASMKEEILGEVRAEIRKCFEEFLPTKSP